MIDAVCDQDLKESSFGWRLLCRGKLEHSKRSVLICLSSLDKVKAEKSGPRGLPCVNPSAWIM